MGSGEGRTGGRDRETTQAAAGGAETDEQPTPGAKLRGRLLSWMAERTDHTMALALDVRRAWDDEVHDELAKLRQEAAGVEDEVPALRETAVAVEKAATEAVAASEKAMEAMLEAKAELADAWDELEGRLAEAEEGR